MRPALLMRMSMRPNSFSVASTREAAAFLSARSPAIARAFRPAFRIASLVASAGRVLPWQATSAPAAPRAKAMAAPMPLAAPVTSATAPSRRKGSDFMLLPAGFEARLHDAERRLDIDDAELTIFPFALR